MELPLSLLKLCKLGLVLPAAAVRQCANVAQPMGLVDVGTHSVDQDVRQLLPNIAASQATTFAVCRTRCFSCCWFPKICKSIEMLQKAYRGFQKM